MEVGVHHIELLRSLIKVPYRESSITEKTELKSYRCINAADVVMFISPHRKS